METTGATKKNRSSTLGERALLIQRELGLGCAFYGSAALEKPVFYFHGIPGTKVEGRWLDTIAASLGATVIALDRPGYGDSAFSPARKLRCWARTVEQTADLLGVGRFRCLGISGGGPYALTCARFLPDRVVRTGIVSSVAPPQYSSRLTGVGLRNKLFFKTARICPALTRIGIKALGQIAARAPHLIDRWQLCYANLEDQSITGRSEILELLQQNLRSAIRTGVQGLLHDFLLVARPWEFLPEEIEGEVYLWHGLRDSTVSIEMGKSLAERIPGCKSFYVADGGHLIALSHAEEILTAVMKE